MSAVLDILRHGVALLNKFGLTGFTEMRDGALFIRVAGGVDEGSVSINTRSDFLCACRELPQEVKLQVEVDLLNDTPTYKFGLC